MTTASQEGASSPTVDPLLLPLESDPPWLTTVVLAITAVCVGAFVALFTRTPISPGLGVLPGMTLGVFVGSAVAAYARRRGATLTLDTDAYRVAVRDASQVLSLVDVSYAYAAVLLIDRNTGRRVLALGQRGDTEVIFEAPNAMRSAAPEAWKARTITTDVDALALTAACPHVVALAQGVSLDPLLARLAATLDETAPWLSQHTASGVGLQVTSTEVRYGSHRVLLDATLKALAYTVTTPTGPVAALGLARGEGALLLVACEDAFVEKNAVLGNLAPDVYVPLTTYELLRAVVERAA
jgi:hypothetical protein